MRLTHEGRLQAGNCPINVAIDVDTTAFGRGVPVANAVSHATLEAAATTIDHGGWLRVALVGANAYRPVVVYSGERVGSSGSDQLEQLQQEASIRSDLTSTIQAAFNPQAPRSAALAATLHQLSGYGSDLGRAVGAGMTAAAAAGRPSAVVLLSDGVNETPDLSLDHSLGRPGLAIKLAQLAGEGSTPHVGLVAVLGVGLVPQRFGGPTTSATATRLVGIWQTACARLNGKKCVVKPELGGE